MKETFEISRQGLKLSYRRFLSDTAIGLSIIAIIIFVFTDSFSYLHFIKNSTIADKTFFYTLMLMLATPLGLLVNISSWILFGFFQYYLAMDFVVQCQHMGIIGRFIFFSTEKKYRIIEMCEFFQLNQNNFYRIVKKIESFLDSFIPASISYKNDLIGMRIFYRNVSFVLLITAIALFSKGYNITTFILILSFSIFFLIANVILNIYYIFFHLIKFHQLLLAERSGNDELNTNVISEIEIDLFINKMLLYYFREEINI